MPAALASPDHRGQYTSMKMGGKVNQRTRGATSGMDSSIERETNVSPAADRDPAPRAAAPDRQPGWASLALRLGARAAFRPRLALDLIRLVWAFRRRGWYRRAPFLPLPPTEYIRWRMHTAYGDEHAVPPAADIERFARWRREVMHL